MNDVLEMILSCYLIGSLLFFWGSIRRRKDSYGDYYWGTTFVVCSLWPLLTVSFLVLLLCSGLWKLFLESLKIKLF